MEKEFILLTQSDAVIQERYRCYFSVMSSKDHNNRKLFGGHSFCIGLFPDSQRLLEYLSDPYFKLCTANSMNVKGAGISRIYFRNLRIEKDNDNPEVKITIDVLKDLNIAMTKYYSNYKGIIGTVFDDINNFLDDFASSYEYKYERVTKCPDFTVLDNYTNPNNAISLC